jgi:hypothetical protein
MIYAPNGTLHAILELSIKNEMRKYVVTMRIHTKKWTSCICSKNPQRLLRKRESRNTALNYAGFRPYGIETTSYRNYHNLKIPVLEVELAMFRSRRGCPLP